MAAPKFLISPKTKVGELLDAYPALEPVLMEMSPAFEKLKNPVLRKTIARVATLQQVAVVGGINVEDIVNRLRKEIGQNSGMSDNSESTYLSDELPEWFDSAKITVRLDASPVINSGGSPMNDILHDANRLNPGEILELQTPFVPAPIIDMLRGKGFIIFCIQTEDYVKSYIRR
jgi:hypothetical protein